MRTADIIYYVYIMTNVSRGVLYVGMTSDLPGRATEHRERLIDGFTNRMAVLASSGSSPTLRQPQAACPRTRHQALAPYLENRIGASAAIPTRADRYNAVDAGARLRVVGSHRLSRPRLCGALRASSAGMQTLVFLTTAARCTFRSGVFASRRTRAPPLTRMWHRRRDGPSLEFAHEKLSRPQSLSKADEYSALWFSLPVPSVYCAWLTEGVGRYGQKLSSTILDEIKRTATANGNVPLGARQFEREFSIRHHMNGVATGLVPVIAERKRGSRQTQRKPPYQMMNS